MESKLKLAGLIALTLTITACGGGSGDTTDESDAGKTPVSDTPSDQTPTDDTASLTLDEKRALAFAAIEAAYEVPEESKPETYQAITDGLQLSDTDLSGTWVKIHKEKKCYEADCKVTYSRKILRFNETGFSLSTSNSCDESIKKDDEGNLTYFYYPQDGMYGPMEIDRISNKHLRGYVRDGISSIEAVADYYKISDEDLIMGDISGTVDVNGDGERSDSGKINCYYELAIVDHKFKKGTTEHNVHIAAHTISSGSVVVHFKPDDSYTISYREAPHKYFETEVDFLAHDYSFDKSMWTASGTFNYFYSQGSSYRNTKGEFSFAIADFSTPAEE